MRPVSSSAINVFLLLLFSKIAVYPLSSDNGSNMQSYAIPIKAGQISKLKPHPSIHKGFDHKMITSLTFKSKMSIDEAFLERNLKRLGNCSKTFQSPL